MRKIALALSVSLLLSTSAYADDWHGHGDIHHFHEHDYDHWRGGGWHQGFHEGRNGWWWVVDGVWYNYPAPVYPYPDPYTPPGVVVGAVPVAPIGVPPTYAYYCVNPAGYYPYVPECFRPWQRVATAPAAVPLAPAPVPISQPVPVAQPAPVAAPMTTPSDGTREADDRQLNAYAVELNNIETHKHGTASELKTLEGRVEEFRQILYHRTYNAMDILHDAENLEHRIEAQRQEVIRHSKNVQQPLAVQPVQPVPQAAPLPDNAVPVFPPAGTVPPPQ